MDEWVRLYLTHPDAVREIMDREHMYVEAAFTDTVDGVDYLYWYSMQNEHSGSAEPHDHWFDEHHTRFWRTCIDEGFPAEELIPRILLTPDGVQAAPKA